MYGQHDQQHLFQQQQRQQQLQQQQQMQQPSMGCGNSFGSMQQQSTNSGFGGGGMGVNNSFGGGVSGMGGSRGMPGLGGGVPGAGSGLQGLGTGAGAPLNGGLGGAGRLGGGGGGGGGGGFGMQGQPASYNPSGEILAMINKGQNLGSLGLPPNQSPLGNMGGAMGGGLPVGLNQPGMPSVGQGGPGGLGGLGLPGQPDLGQTMGSIPSTPSFDMSDFPSLGNRPGGSAPASGMQQFRSGLQQGGLGGMAGLGGMPGVPQQQLPPQSEFAIQNEDFPALPGAGPAPTGGGDPSGMGGSSIGGDFRGVESMLGGLGGLGKEGGQGLGSGASSGLDGSTDRYGLMGLLSVIRMTDQDLNTLALGTDLTTLGLNLNSSECLYATFASPWADTPAQRDPEFSLPHCYYMQPPALKTGHFSKFQLETLFYIFYNMPRDTLQAYAATELYNRDWRYHKDLKLWFTKASRQGNADTQKGQYIYFDINEWKKKMFHGASGSAGGVGGAGGDVEGESAAGIEDL